MQVWEGKAGRNPNKRQVIVAINASQFNASMARKLSRMFPRGDYQSQAAEKEGAISFSVPSIPIVGKPTKEGLRKV